MTRHLLTFLKDPLAHFLGLGILLFALYHVLNPASDRAGDLKRIIIDRSALLTFIQYRTKSFDPDAAAAQLDALPPASLQRLVDDFAREEALYREAEALGLGDNDYIIKRRMIQKVDFITEGFADASVRITEEELQAYYEANLDRYREAGFITFTHVFFDAGIHGPKVAVSLAEAKLTELQAEAVPFIDAPRHGDRFPFGVNYVERSQELVASQFGTEMAAALFELNPAEGIWRGPYRSAYGAHLVMVIKRQDPSVRPLTEVRSRVLGDAKGEKVRERSEEAVMAIVDTYEIDLRLDGQLAATLGQGAE